MQLNFNTCCFTGHRILPKADISTIHNQLIQVITQLIESGYAYFMAGGALGFDTLASQIVLNLREDYPQIKLILALPCREQAQKWRTSEIAEYERIRELSDGIIYVSEHYYKGCMLVRNRYLVERSSACISYCTNTSGGTFYTVNCAMNAGLQVFNIAP